MTQSFGFSSLKNVKLFATSYYESVKFSLVSNAVIWEIYDKILVNIEDFFSKTGRKSVFSLNYSKYLKTCFKKAYALL